MIVYDLSLYFRRIDVEYDPEREAVAAMKLAAEAAGAERQRFAALAWIELTRLRGRSRAPGSRKRGLAHALLSSGQPVRAYRTTGVGSLIGAAGVGVSRRLLSLETRPLKLVALHLKYFARGAKSHSFAMATHEDFV